MLRAVFISLGFFAASGAAQTVNDRPRPTLNVAERPIAVIAKPQLPRLTRTIASAVPVQVRTPQEFEQIRQTLLARAQSLPPQSPEHAVVAGQLYTLYFDIARLNTAQIEANFERAWLAWFDRPEGTEPRPDLSTLGPAWSAALDAATRYAQMVPPQNLPLETRVGTGMALAYLKRTDEARQQYESVIKDFPQTPSAGDAHAGLGDLAYDAADFDTALRHYRACLASEQSRYLGWCHYKAGWTKVASRNFVEGARAWRAAHRIFAKTHPTVQGLVLRQMVAVAAQGDNLREDIGFFQNKKTDTGAPYLPILGRTYLAFGNENGAFAALKTYIIQNPKASDLPQVHLELIRYLFQSGRYPAVWKEMGDFRLAYHPRGPWAQAQKVKPKSFESGVEDDLRYHAMLLHKRSLQNPSLGPHARAGYQTFLKMFPSSPSVPDIRLLLADIDYATGNFGNAAKAFEEAAQAQPAGTPKQFPVARDMVLASFRNFEPEFATLIQKEPDFKNPKPLSFRAQNYVDACKRYMGWFPNDKAVSDNCQTNISKIRYHSGESQGGASSEGPPVAPAAASTPMAVASPASPTSPVPPVAPPKPAPQSADKESFKRAVAIEDQLKNNPTDPRKAQLLLEMARLYAVAGRSAQTTNAYLRVAREHPDSNEARIAYWDLADYSERHLELQNAASHYYLYATKYPNESNATYALTKSCELHIAIDSQYAADVCARLATVKPDAARPYFERMLDIAELDRKFSDVIKLTQNHYLARFTLTPVQRMTAHHRIYRMLNRTGDSAEQAARAIEQEYKAGGKSLPPQARTVMADVLYHRAEPTMREYRTRKLDVSNPTKFASSLQNKRQGLNKVKTAYQGILDLNAPEWNVAALYQIGMGYEHLAQVIAVAAEHKKLKKQAAAYQAEAQREIQMALKIYRSALDQASRGKVYTFWTARSWEAVQRVTDRRLTVSDYLPTPDFMGAEIPLNFVGELKGETI